MTNFSLQAIQQKQTCRQDIIVIFFFGKASAVLNEDCASNLKVISWGRIYIDYKIIGLELLEVAKIDFYFKYDIKLIIGMNHAGWLHCIERTHPPYLHASLAWVL